MDTESNLLVLEVLFLALFNEGAHAFLLVGGGEAHGEQLVLQSDAVVNVHLHAAERLGLRPVMRLKSCVSTIKVLDPDTTVSYGRTFRTEGKTRMGVLPIGYADGFFRGLSNRMAVQTAYGPAPQRGRICMDMCMVDLTDLPEVKVGDTVEIFGQTQSVDTLAAILDTIPYELTCAVSKRVPRLYMENGKEIERSLRLL